MFKNLNKKKVGKLLVTHRYNHLSLLPSGPGEVQQELVVQDLPGTKVETFSELPKLFFISVHFFILVFFARFSVLFCIFETKLI